MKKNLKEARLKKQCAKNALCLRTGESKENSRCSKIEQVVLRKLIGQIYE